MDRNHKLGGVMIWLPDITTHTLIHQVPSVLIGYTRPHSTIKEVSAPAMGSHWFNPGLRHNKVVKRGSGIAPLLSSKYKGRSTIGWSGVRII